MKRLSIISRSVRILVYALIACCLIAAILHLDIGLRVLNRLTSGQLDGQTLRFEVAAFGLGQPAPLISTQMKISEIDAMPQMFVPAGEFEMGFSNTGNAPKHTVYLDAFWMDQIEVTNAMYLQCMQAGGCSAPAVVNETYSQWIFREHPITYVTWFQAEAYCAWANRRLPTEAEWEKAARGTDGRAYPWGNEAPNPRLANFEETLFHEAISAYRYPLGASPYGVLNMSGNVREWVFDWYADDYYQNSPYANPQGPPTGGERSLRSGSYNEDRREIRVFHRYNHVPDSPGLSRGFRCAQSDP